FWRILEKELAKKLFPQHKPIRYSDSGGRNYEWAKEDREANNKLTVSCSESDAQCVQLLDLIPNQIFQ
ncbi:3362_t:CDS:1, partial [Ambispora leptoticha]